MDETQETGLTLTREEVDLLHRALQMTGLHVPVLPSGGCH